MDLKSILKKFKESESVLSSILGVFVVLIVGFLIFKYFQENKPEQSTESEISTQENSDNESGETKLPEGSYQVKKGDNLWKIAESYYGSGFNWIDIAKANNLSNPGQIDAGNQLVIPNIPKKIVQSTPVISGNSYEVIKGDSLWKIAVRAYGDGFKWSVIAKSNNLTYPSLIHPGNVLSLPR